MPIPRGIELLKALMTEDNLQSSDLVPIFGNESTVIEVLNEKQDLTAKQIQNLSVLFHISPMTFLAKD